MSRQFRIPVVAALIERDGEVLIAQRKKGARHELKWEFPGGKIEHGESPRAALARELQEELGIHAEIGPEITRYEYAYPKGAAIQLIFLRVVQFQGDLHNAVFEQVKWERREELTSYDFLDGDLEFVRRLAAGDFQ
ncbi:MAG: (deoxy)nucleoside triphosphate pyrophosphohydrolase [Bryobacteraceae bacterium]|nr:(deoxy)nucleoside triphosphate pyrophosphohydrolase [Bryobacteraceae bacterium]